MLALSLNRLWREPLLHFVVLGALLLFAQQLWGERWSAFWFPERIEVTASDRERVAAAWQRETGRTPEPRELETLLRGWVDDELLFREAKRLGLHRNDPVVRQRLLTNMRFAEQQWADEADGAEASGIAADLLESAERLGMVDRDLVVRGRLIQRMRYRIEHTVRVTPDEVQAYLQAQGDAVQSPERVRFEQRYFGPTHTSATVAQWREALQAGDAVAGDPFLLGQQFDTHAATVAQRFGPAVAAAVAEAPLGQWVGPVASVYGLHLLRVESRQSGAVPYAEKRAAMILLAERERAAVREQLDQLRRRYRITIEAPSA